MSTIGLFPTHCYMLSHHLPIHIWHALTCVKRCADTPKLLVKVRPYIQPAPSRHGFDPFVLTFQLFQNSYRSVGECYRLRRGGIDPVGRESRSSSMLLNLPLMGPKVPLLSVGDYHSPISFGSLSCGEPSFEFANSLRSCHVSGRRWHTEHGSNLDLIDSHTPWAAAQEYLRNHSTGRRSEPSAS